MNKKIFLCTISMFLFLYVGDAFSYRYTNEHTTISGKEYIYHRFIFNRAEIDEIAGSYRKAQGYANGMIDTIWDLARGMGSNLGRFTGRVWLGDRLFRMAKEAKQDNWNEMGVEIRSRADKSGKWALEFLDNVADMWKKLAGKK